MRLRSPASAVSPSSAVIRRCGSEQMPRYGSRGVIVLGARRPRRVAQVDLVGDLEAVDVVVHRVEESQPAVGALEARDLAPLEDSALPRARAVEIGARPARPPCACSKQARPASL